MTSATNGDTTAKSSPVSKFHEAVAMVIDPQWICRNGLKHLILEHTDHSRVIEAEDIETAQGNLAKWKKIKIIIMEVVMPGGDPLENFEAVREAADTVPILAISDDCSREEILGAINLGAAGFITKSAGGEEILHAMRSIEGGEIHISKTLFEKTETAGRDRLKANTRERNVKVAGLTRRQREVLEELGQGQSNRSIAQKLGVSEHTVKIHVAAILKALGVANRTQAALLVQPYIVNRA